MPAWLQAIILGVVQGLTEFVPVSSSAHLVLVPYLAGWPKPGLAFDVALHMGTFGAVAVYFRAELAAMARGLLGRGGADGRLYRSIAALVALGSIPVVVVGLLLEETVGDAFASPVTAALLLLVSAALLYGGERLRDRRVAAARAAGEPQAPFPPPPPATRAGSAALGQAPRRVTLPVGADPQDPAGRSLTQLGPTQALIVGGLQVLALLPGVSRSGATISAGLAAGLTREAATRFSFLLSLPALLGAFVLSLPELGAPGPYSPAAITGGVVAAFVSGYAAIRFLVALVARDRLTGFAGYCLVAAVVALVGIALVGPAA